MRFLSLAILALISHAAGASGPDTCVDRAGFGPRTVAEFGGSLVAGESVYVLNASERPSLLVIPRIGSPRKVNLATAARRIEKAGLARASDGTLCALSAGGRTLLCFDPDSGAQVREQLLSSRMQGVWNVAGLMSYAAFEGERGGPMLTTEKTSEGGFHSPLPSRSGSGSPSGMLANLFSCGTGTADQTPCWFLEPAEILILSREKPPQRIAVPPLTGMASHYPIRSVLLTADVIWFLINDPPSRPESIAGDGRRLAHWDRRSNTVRSYSLPGPARGLVEGNAETALIVFRDGRVERCGNIRSAIP